MLRAKILTITFCGQAMITFGATALAGALSKTFLTFILARQHSWCEFELKSGNSIVTTWSLLLSRGGSALVATLWALGWLPLSGRIKSSLVYFNKVIRHHLLEEGWTQVKVQFAAWATNDFIQALNGCVFWYTGLNWAAVSALSFVALFLSGWLTLAYFHHLLADKLDFFVVTLSVCAGFSLKEAFASMWKFGTSYVNLGTLIRSCLFLFLATRALDAGQALARARRRLCTSHSRHKSVDYFRRSRLRALETQRAIAKLFLHRSSISQHEASVTTTNSSNARTTATTTSTTASKINNEQPTPLPPPPRAIEDDTILDEFNTSLWSVVVGWSAAHFVNSVFVGPIDDAIHLGDADEAALNVPATTIVSCLLIAFFLHRSSMAAQGLAACEKEQRVATREQEQPPPPLDSGRLETSMCGLSTSSQRLGARREKRRLVALHRLRRANQHVLLLTNGLALVVGWSFEQCATLLVCLPNAPGRLIRLLLTWLYAALIIGVTPITFSLLYAYREDLCAEGEEKHRSGLHRFDSFGLETSGRRHSISHDNSHDRGEGLTERESHNPIRSQLEKDAEAAHAEAGKLEALSSSSSRQLQHDEGEEKLSYSSSSFDVNSASSGRPMSPARSISVE